MTMQTIMSVLPLMFNGEAKAVIITADTVNPLLMADGDEPITARHTQASGEFKVRVDCPFPYTSAKHYIITVGKGKSEEVAPYLLIDTGATMQVDFDCDGFNLVVDFRIDPKSFKLTSQITLRAGDVVYLQYTTDDERNGAPPYYREMSGCIVQDHHRTCELLSTLAEAKVTLNDGILMSTYHVKYAGYLPTL